MRSILFSSLCFIAMAISTMASPRKHRDFTFKNNPAYDLSLRQDAEAKKLQQEAIIIQEESREGPRLTERRHGETFLQYRERLEQARQRMEIHGDRDESLRESQREALLKAQYALRRETFAGSHNPYGNGAGPTGDRYQHQFELGRLWEYLFGSEDTVPEPAMETEEKSE